MNFNTLQDNELLEMKMLYQEELDKTLKRLAHIKSILEKLNVNTVIPEVATDAGTVNDSSVVPDVKKTTNSGEAETKVVELKESAAAAAKTKSKKRGTTGPKSVLEQFVTKRLRAMKRPLSLDELTDELMIFGQIPAAERKQARQKVVPFIRRYKRLGKKFDSYDVSNKERYVGLKSWFDQPGVLKETYLNRIIFKPVVEVKPKPEKKVFSPKNHPSWIAYVLDLLVRANKPLYVKSMTLLAMEENEIDNKMYDKTRLAVARSLSTLVKKDKKVVRYGEKGKNPGLYVLPEWMDENSKLLDVYAQKLND